MITVYPKMQKSRSFSVHSPDPNLSLTPSSSKAREETKAMPVHVAREFSDAAREYSGVATEFSDATLHESLNELSKELAEDNAFAEALATALEPHYESLTPPSTPLRNSPDITPAGSPKDPLLFSTGGGLPKRSSFKAVPIIERDPPKSILKKPRQRKSV